MTLMTKRNRPGWDFCAPATLLHERSLPMRKVLILLSLIAAIAVNAFAWGEEGHRIVCRIAYDELTADQKKEVDRLTKAYQTPEDTRLSIKVFPDGCVFPDEARSQERAAEKNHVTDSPWLHFKPF